MNILGRASLQTSKFPGIKLRLTPNQPKPTKRKTKKVLLKGVKRRRKKY